MFPSADLVARLASRGRRRHPRSRGAATPAGSTRCACSARSGALLVIVLDAAKGALAGFVGLAIGDAGRVRGGHRGDRRSLLAGVDTVPRRARASPPPAGRSSRCSRRWSRSTALIAARGRLSSARARASRSGSRCVALGGRRRRCGGRPTCRTGGAPSRRRAPRLRGARCRDDPGPLPARPPAPEPALDVHGPTVRVIRRAGTGGE